MEPADGLVLSVPLLPEGRREEGKESKEDIEREESKKGK